MKRFAEANLKTLPKSIDHLEDLTPDEFLRFLAKYQDLPLKGGLEVSEKLDGSARISFGPSDEPQVARLWVASKNSPRRYSPREWGREPMFLPIRAAHEALQKNSAKILSHWPEGLQFLTAEVLEGPIPNSIEYGPSAIVVHGITGNVSEEEVREFVQKVGNLDEWRFDFKTIVDPKKIHTDVSKEFETLSQLHKALKGDKVSKEKFKEIQLAVKKKLVRQLKSVQSAYGPEGGDIEGLVFRDLESGQMAKLVDRDYFTKLNQFLWHYRELINKGTKVDGEWKPGVKTRWYWQMAEEVFQFPGLKSPTIIRRIQDFSSSLDIPKDVDPIDFTLAKFVEANDLAPGDFLPKAYQVLDSASKEFQTLRSEWDGKKQGEISIDLGDKKRKMHDVHKTRTDQAFEQAAQFFIGARKSLEAIGNLKGDLTKRTALLKLYLGQHRLEKLSLQPKGGDVKENVLKEDTALAYSAGKIILSFEEKLEKKGLKVGKFIGAGTKGAAFQLEDGRVLKITTDTDEARSSQHVKGKNFKHICRIDDVFRFPDIKPGVVWFGIVQEKLTKISPQEGHAFVRAYNFFDDLVQGQGREKWAKPWDKIMKDVKNVVQVKGDEGFTRKVKLAVDILKKFQFPEILKDLESAGVKFNDFHDQNIMKRGEDFVLIDLGYSVAPENQVPVLEKLVKEVVMNLKEDARDEFIMRKFSDKLFKRKIPVDTAWVLGDGSRGTAFDLENGTVLKVTEDESEAVASNRIKGKKLKHVVQVYDVFRFPDVKGEHPHFGIVQEKLSGISDKEGKEFTMAFNSVLHALQDYKGWTNKGFAEQPWNKIEKEILSIINDGLHISPNSQNQLKKQLDVLKRFNLPEIMTELQSQGIKFIDYHGGNLMKRGTTYVITDLGYSEAPPSKIATLEKKVFEAIIKEIGEDDLFGDLKWDDIPGEFDPNKAKQADDAGEAFKIGKMDRETAIELLKKNRDTIKQKRGIDVGENPQFLGQGTRGTAFGIPGEKVIKVTDDKTEAQAMQKCMDSDLKFVVKVFDVFRFREGEIFGITQEELEPLDLDESKEVQEILGTTAIASFLEKNAHNWEPARDACFEFMTKQVEKLQSEEERQDYKKQIRRAWELLTKKYKINQMAKELSKAGIAFNDYSGQNIMKRKNGQYILIDLGYSKVQGGKEPPTLENVLKEIKSLDEDVEVVASTWKRHVPKLQQHGFQLGKELGRGSNGIAFVASKEGKKGVLKLTTDVSEAKTSNHIKGKKLKHVVNIYDVFRLPDSPVFGIFQEKLADLGAEEEDGFDRLIGYLEDAKAGREMLAGNIEGCIKKVKMLFTNPVLVDDFLSLVKHFKFGDMIGELSQNQIEFLDYHVGNLKKRGKDYVLLDLGMSRSPGVAPGPIESIIREMVTEAKADTIGVTIGRFQPFHKGHGEMIRELTSKFDKVLVIVAGNGKDKKSNPFSFETRVDMMKKSLPDVWTKLEIHKAEFGGKNSGYLPGILGDIITNKKSTLEADVAVNILVGQDRLPEIQQQMKHAQQYRENGNETAFDPSMAVVAALPDVKNDDEVERVSGTAARELLMKGDEEGFKKVVDPHLLSNPADFEDIYIKLREELGLKEKKLSEDLRKAGGVDALLRVAKVNANVLKNKFGIDVESMTKLGNGMDGVALDIGGGKVLKITTDIPEALASYSLKGKKKKHIVTVFDAFRFKKTAGIPGLAIYGIILEKLQKLSPQEYTDFHELEDYIFDKNHNYRVNDLLPTADMHQISDAVMDNIQKEVTATYGVQEDNSTRETVPQNVTRADAPGRNRNAIKNRKQQSAQQEINKKYARFLELMEQFSIIDILQELKEEGIKFQDLHKGNVMKRGTNYVVTDLGRSQTTGHEPPAVEMVDRMVGAVMGKMGSSAWSNASKITGPTKTGKKKGKKAR